MPLNNSELADIVGRARSLAECHASEAGSVPAPADKALPAWSLLLSELSAESAEAFSKPESNPFNRRDCTKICRNIPFAHLFWPTVEAACRRVDDRFPGVNIVTEPALTGLQRYLLTRLSGIASSALQLSFLVHQSIQSSGMFAHWIGCVPVTGDVRGMDVYRRFVQEQGVNGLRDFWLKFSVAARLQAQVVQDWIDFVQEFLQRLRDDLPSLASVFNSGREPGRVCAIKAGISDPHRSGRSVLILNFANGSTLVYKPRSMAIDGVFFNLIAELNACRAAPDLPVLKTVDRGTHGWMEFAQYAPCANRRAARDYYRRAGALTCVLHWLQAVDCHRENLVATGEYPVLVDCEAIAHPLRPDEIDSFASSMSNPLAASVLRTGMLPLWMRQPSSSGWYDNGGLDAPLSQPAFFASDCWKKVNTDEMQCTRALLARRHSAHRPVLNGRVLYLRQFGRELLAGYRQMAALLEGPGANRFTPWRDLAWRTPRRWIRKPTWVYGLLLRRSLQPEYLGCGASRSLALRILPREAENDSIRDEEIASLEKLDIPYFEHRGEAAGQTSLPNFDRAFPRNLKDQEATIALAIQRRLGLLDGCISELPGSKAP